MKYIMRMLGFLSKGKLDDSLIEGMINKKKNIILVFDKMLDDLTTLNEEQISVGIQLESERDKIEVMMKKVSDEIEATKRLSEKISTLLS